MGESGDQKRRADNWESQDIWDDKSFREGMYSWINEHKKLSSYKNCIKIAPGLKNLDGRLGALPVVLYVLKSCNLLCTKTCASFEIIARYSYFQAYSVEIFDSKIFLGHFTTGFIT